MYNEFINKYGLELDRLDKAVADLEQGKKVDFNAIFVDEKLEGLEKGKNSIYNAFVERYYQDYQRILKGIGKLPKMLVNNALTDGCKLEYAVGGNVARGFYCPSKVIDVCVGGLKKGKLLKRPNKRSKPSFCYYFKDSRLKFVKHYVNGKECSTEELTYSENKIIGLEYGDELLGISEEEYFGGNLISYKHYYVEQIDGKADIKSDIYERYGYENGDNKPTYCDMCFNGNVYEVHRMTMRYENGLIAGYDFETFTKEIR